MPKIIPNLKILHFLKFAFLNIKKSCLTEALNLLTDADSSTIIMKCFRYIYIFLGDIKKNCRGKGSQKKINVGIKKT